MVLKCKMQCSDKKCVSNSVTVVKGWILFYKPTLNEPFIMSCAHLVGLGSCWVSIFCSLVVVSVEHQRLFNHSKHLYHTHTPVSFSPLSCWPEGELHRGGFTPSGSTCNDGVLKQGFSTPHILIFSHFIRRAGTELRCWGCLSTPCLLRGKEYCILYCCF